MKFSSTGWESGGPLTKIHREDKNQVATCFFQGRSFEQRFQYPSVKILGSFLKMSVIDSSGIPEPKNQAIFFWGADGIRTVKAKIEELTLKAMLVVGRRDSPFLLIAF